MFVPNTEPATVHQRMERPARKYCSALFLRQATTTPAVGMIKSIRTSTVMSTGDNWLSITFGLYVQEIRQRPKLEVFE